VIIKDLKIDKYKSIKSPIFLNFSDLNIFIGQNNCGKSNILDALEFIFNEEKDLPTGQAGKTNLFYPDASIRLRLELDSEKQKKYNSDKKIELVLNKGKRKIFNEKILNFLKQNLKRLDEESFSNYKQIRIDYNTLYNYPHNLNKFKEHLKIHFPKIVIDENAMDLKYENDGLYEGKRRVTMDYLGSGFGRIFTILLYIFHPEYTVVMINEPEIHLHPAIIKKLLWAMKNSQAGQIFFTTHSPLFVTPSTLANLFRVSKDNKNTNVYSLDEGCYDHERLVQELNADNLEMFFADQVILVEGPSDQLLLRGLVNCFYKGEKEIKIIQVYGKSNISIYVDLLKIFKIPFLIILDRDVLKGYQLMNLMRHLEINLSKMNDEELIKELKKYNIFIFPNGDLEDNYPKKYQNEKSKSRNALLAVNQITDADFYSKKMKNIREIIKSI
jgi:predicted ATP-dependent endonuclease of OLD family